MSLSGERREDVTDILVALRNGETGAMTRLMPLVYDELRRLAHYQLLREAPGHTLSTTALVHDAYLKLVDQRRAQWVDRKQFFNVAAQAMRRVLLDYARRHHALRRGGDKRRVDLGAVPEDALAAVQRSEEMLALDEALDRLAALDERLRQVVDYKFFNGLTDAEAAERLGVDPRTIGRDWKKARAWLYQEIYGDAG